MNKLMCHLVAGYPDRKACLELLQGLSKSGVAAIEVQVPFSDPIADGETIMEANDVALKHGMTTAGSFELIKTARRHGVDADVYVMSYIQKIRHFGFEEFSRQASACGVKGLIIPDLPYDSPEYPQLRAEADKNRLELVPVLSPDMPSGRLRAVLALSPPTVYVTSVRGITGNSYAPDPHLKRLIAAIREQSQATVMIGFGIASARDVADALDLGDMAVVGSAVINKLKKSNVPEAIRFVKSLVAGQA